MDTDAQFRTDILYSLIAVADPTLDRTLNDWEQQHVDQGFSWREGSVSFATLKSGTMLVQVTRRAIQEPNPRAVRVIRVPFLVSSAAIKVATVGSSRTVPVPNGNYALVYETGLNESGEMWCCFTFDDAGPLSPEVMRADARLSPEYPLLMTARPA